MNDKDIKDNMYSIKELEDYLKNNFPEVDVAAKNIFRIFRQHYPTYLYNQSIKKTYIYKDIVKKIDFNYVNYLKDISKDRTIKSTIDVGLRNGFCQRVAGKLLGISPDTIGKIAKEGKFLKYTDETLELINKDEIDYWSEFKKNHTSLYDIYTSIEKEVGKKYNPTNSIKYVTFYKMRKSGQLNQFNIIDEQDTCFPKSYGFVKKELEDEVTNFIYKYLEKVIIITYGTEIELLEFHINNAYSNEKIKQTIKYLSLFTNDRISKTASVKASRYYQIMEEIMKLDKELFDCNDDEVSKILLNLNTKSSRSEYCYFLMYLKEVTNTKYLKSYRYDREAVINTKLNTEPYSMEQYLRFGFLVLSDQHIWYEEYINKALSSRAYASIWLYTSFHYICAWRRKDIITSIPHINLGMDPKEFLNKVKNKELNDKLPLEYIEQIKFEINMLNIQPQKTRSKTTPNLILEIPESIKTHIGTLLGIVEAHYQLTVDYKRKNLLTNAISEKEKYKEFFGEEFVDIFKGDGFNNLKATKNYELLTAKNGEEQGVGTGYVLASIARSHKFFGDKKSETTKIYLEHFYKLESSEKILMELYERGVCSFVPYLLTKAIYGEKNVINLDIEEQTKLMKNTVKFDNYDTEMVVQLYDRVVEKSKETISKMIAEYKSQGFDVKKEIEKTLKNIAYNNAPSKNNNVGCIAVAQGKGCLYPKRANCFGCGYEIYLKAYLNELGKYINNIKKAAYTSKTEGSKRKNILIIKDILVPLTEEIFVTLKTIYNINDFTEYKNLLK